MAELSGPPQILQICTKTVGKHMEAIFRKTGAANRTEAAMIANRFSLGIRKSSSNGGDIPAESGMI